jgi:putative SOS response-associated peptidase YedK
VLIQTKHSAFERLTPEHEEFGCKVDMAGGTQGVDGSAPKHVEDGDGEVVVEAMRWGLVPSYTKAPSASEALKVGWKMINARADNLTRVHKSLLDRRRCVVVVDGFYEWLAPMQPSPLPSKESGSSKQQRLSSHKRPFFIRTQDGSPLLLGGLYDSWHDSQAQLKTHTIITTESNNQLSWLHDRMPLILTPAQVPLWLDTARFRFDSDEVQGLITPFTGELDFYEVGDVVNKVQNNRADCLLPLADYKQQQLASGIAAYFAEGGARCQTRRQASASDSTPDPQGQATPVKKTSVPHDESWGESETREPGERGEVKVVGRLEDGEEAMGVEGREKGMRESGKQVECSRKREREAGGGKVGAGLVVRGEGGGGC